jgi:hypothetical protein
MTKLDPNQEAALEHAAQADLRWRDAKTTIRKRAREFVERELAVYSSARDLAVYEAVKSGVPQRRVGMDALHTTSPNTVREILDRVAESVQLGDVELALKPTARYSWSTEVTVGEQTFRYLLDAQHPETVSQALGDVPEHVGYRYGRGWGGEWKAISVGVPEEAAKWAEVNS